MKTVSRAIAMALCAATIASAAPVQAQAESSAQDVRQLKAKDVPDIASGKAFIVYETLEGKFDVFFLRSLSPEEIVQFDENRKTALAEERERLRRKRNGAPGVSDEEVLPDAEFSFVDRSIRNLVRLDSGRVFARDGKTRTYVVEVPAGEYTIFGAGIDGFTSGTCMCMGSVRFEAKAGEVTDLGSVLVAAEDGKTSIPELAPYEAPEYIRRKTWTMIMSVRPPSPGDSVPANLSGLPIAPVDYRAADKFPNFQGMIVNRMPPIEGILAYDLDQVIDLKTEAAEAPIGTERAGAAEQKPGWITDGA